MKSKKILSLLTLWFIPVVFVFILSGCQISGQSFFSFFEKDNKPHWPLEIQSPISGTFGEYRTQNLHMGLDFKTYGLNGIKILATYDGFIQFLSQKDKGYGLSIHLHSPEHSLTTKYAHLFSFLGENPKLESLRLALNLLSENPEFQFQLPPNQFPVKKGEWIALSGESGTGGPHLHLEFRDEKGFLNPLPYLISEKTDLHPPTIVKFLWEDDGTHTSKEVDVVQVAPGMFQPQHSPFYGTGKIRMKVMGYDLISSNNKNNIYAYEARLDGKVIYRKEFHYIRYQDSHKKYFFYDTNRSSLSPPLYYYNVYDYDQGYTIDLNTYPKDTKLRLEVVLEDASGKKSKLEVPVVVGEPVEYLTKDHSSNEKPYIRGGKQILYQSPDTQLQIQFSSDQIHGSGHLVIEPTSWEKEGIALPKGLNPVGIAYKISSIHMNWKNKAQGYWKLGRNPTRKEFLYFYDTTIQKFRSVFPQKTNDGFRFSLEKLGILGILEDHSPPSVQYVYQFSPYVHVPGSLPPGFIERYYYLSDLGSGFTSNPTVLLEGEPYPYTYDEDRRAIRILFPRSLFIPKRFLLLEIQPRDYAGNVGETFTEILTEFLPTVASDF